VDNVLLRGSTLRNTEWVIGIVVFTGRSLHSSTSHLNLSRSCC
jgi:magnesium-transporting ATPase (P-type)